MGKTKKLSTSDLILYILQKIEPQRSDKIRLNKIAFFTEFGFYHKRQTELSETRFAGINLGPVIDQYTKVFDDMEKMGLIKIDGNLLRPLSSPSIDLPEETRNVIDPIIEKYSKLSNQELVALSHVTDSYKITTDNNKNMGKIIDKSLASLETFFQEKRSDIVDEENSDFLPKINRNRLVKYAS